MSLRLINCVVFLFCLSSCAGFPYLDGGGSGDDDGVQNGSGSFDSSRKGFLEWTLTALSERETDDGGSEFIEMPLKINMGSFVESRDLLDSAFIEIRVAEPPLSNDLVLSFVEVLVDHGSGVREIDAEDYRFEIAENRSSMKIKFKRGVLGDRKRYRLNLFFVDQSRTGDIYENEANVVFSQAFAVLHGDINGDGVVSFVDANSLRAKLGLEVTSADVLCDEDQSGVTLEVDSNNGRYDINLDQEINCNDLSSLDRLLNDPWRDRRVNDIPSIPEPRLPGEED